MAAYEEQEYNNPFSFRIWMKLFPFFKPYKKFFAITLGLNILLAGVDILVPLFQSYAIDTFIIPDPLDGLGVFTLVYISVIVAQTVCVYVSKSSWVLPQSILLFLSAIREAFPKSHSKIRDAPSHARE